MSSLLGHERNVKLLRRYAEENRPAHAYLFSGRQGVGKKKAALEFARMINCEDFDVHDEPLNCNTCRRILTRSHPDVHLEQPEKNNIRIDAIRKIISFLKYPPIEANFRFVIIDDAHFMNRAAQNALLKTLEEPPPGRIIILVSSQPYSLLQTVRSRLRRINFGPLGERHLKTLLSKHKELSEVESQTALALASGSIERALSKSSPQNVEFRSRVISNIFEKGWCVHQRLLDLSAEAGSEKNKTDDLLEISGTVLRDAIITKLEAGTAIINADQSILVEKISEINTLNHLISAYEEIKKASVLLDLDVNLNKNLVLDVTFLKIESILNRA